MIVTFWSPFGGKSAVTSSLVTVSSLMVIENDTNVLLIGGNGEGGLESYFASIRESSDSSEGMVNVHTLMNTGKLHADALKTRCSYIIQGKLEYLSTQDCSREVLDSTLDVAIKVGSQAYEHVFVDISGSSLPHKVSALTDLLVVCLPQNLSLIKKHKKDLETATEGLKHIVLLGNYEDGAAISQWKIASAIGVSSKDVVTIPHNVALMDALGREDIISFFRRTKAPKKKSLFNTDNDVKCVQDVRKCYNKIASSLKISLLKEEES